MNTIINIYAQSYLYRSFISKMPVPFNDLYFGICVILVIFLLIICCIVDFIKGIAVRKKVREKQESARLRRQEEADEKALMLEKERQDRAELINAFKSVSSGNTNQTTDDGLHDRQTGMFNKLAFDKDIEKISLSSLAIGYFDINDLNKTNETLGKLCGDKLLMGVASELKEKFTGKCYRVGGDEFIVLYDGMGKKIMERRIEQVKEALLTRTNTDSDGIVYSVACGIALGNGEMTRQEVLEYAENEMKKDKEAYKSLLPVDDYFDSRVFDLPDDDNSDDEDNKQVIKNPDDDYANNSEIDMRETDSLTRVLNRQAFDKEVKCIDETHLALIYADIDGLKVINDKLGHSYGDKLIKSFADILNSHFPGRVFRLGDDDFCILIYNVSEEDIIHEIDLVKAEMIKLTNESEDGIFYSASFGIAVNNGEFLYRELVDMSESLLRADKIAFRTGKRSGVILSDMSLMPESTSKADRKSVYDKEAILKSKRELSHDDPVEFAEGNALSVILNNIKDKQDSREREVMENDLRRRTAMKNAERIDEDIKSKYLSEGKKSRLDKRN